MHENDKGELELRFRTERDYGCRNYIIKNTVSQSGNDVNISLLDIVKLDLCLTSLGPATVTINLGVKTNGTYELKIQNGRILNVFDLEVTDEKYRVEPKSNSRNVWFDEPELGRQTLQIPNFSCPLAAGFFCSERPYFTIIKDSLLFRNKIFDDE